MAYALQVLPHTNQIIKTMIQVKPRFQSFEEYLSYDDGTNKLYESFNGELKEFSIKTVVLLNIG